MELSPLRWTFVGGATSVQGQHRFLWEGDSRELQEELLIPLPSVLKPWREKNDLVRSERPSNLDVPPSSLSTSVLHT